MKREAKQSQKLNTNYKAKQKFRVRKHNSQIRKAKHSKTKHRETAVAERSNDGVGDGEEEDVSRSTVAGEKRRVNERSCTVF